MNWSKYSLDEWLVQFGAWCDTCRMRTGNKPKALNENVINKLMIEAGSVFVSNKNSVSCKISDREALEVQDLILSAYNRADDEMKQAIQYLFVNKVIGCSLRKISNFNNINRIDLTTRIYGAKCFIAGMYGFVTINIEKCC